MAGDPSRAEDAAAPPVDHGLTAVTGLRVGHAEMAERTTGVTAILTGDGAVAAVDVRGGGPGTRELALLAPENLVRHVHGLCLAGGSAFGLDAAGGVVAHLDSLGIGYPTSVARVPIVPAAILYDLAVGGRPDVRPDADCGRRAAEAASAGPVAEGSVGAGAGATVGKLLGPERGMRGGLGSSALRLGDGTTVASLAVVNAVGNVVDPSDGRIVAGAREGDELLDLRRPGDLGRWMPGLEKDPMATPIEEIPSDNTTLAVVATDAALDKSQTLKIAQMAQDGLARTLYPAHTPFDGDTVFALATGLRPGPADPVRIAWLGAIAATLLAEAVLRGVRLATGLPGLPAVADLRG